MDNLDGVWTMVDYGEISFVIWIWIKRVLEIFFCSKTFVARIWALGVKPAVEDVDADCFLAFQSAWLKTESSPTYFLVMENVWRGHWLILYGM